MSTFNGIGTKLYGKTDVEADGSYIATKWVVVVYIPIIPLESIRIIQEKSTNLVVYSSKQYSYISVPLHKQQVLKTYAWVVGIVVVLAVLANL